MAEYTYVNKILNLGLDSCLAPLASGKFVQTVCSSVLLSAAIPSYLFNFREKNPQNTKPISQFFHPGSSMSASASSCSETGPVGNQL